MFPDLYAAMVDRISIVKDLDFHDTFTELYVNADIFVALSCDCTVNAVCLEIHVQF